MRLGKKYAGEHTRNRKCGKLAQKVSRLRGPGGVLTEQFWQDVVSSEGLKSLSHLYSLS